MDWHFAGIFLSDKNKLNKKYHQVLIVYLDAVQNMKVPLILNGAH